jgi:hypothetical protein
MNKFKVPKGLSDLPEKADRTVLRTATGAVITWNFLTGGTKTSLANVMLAGSAVANTASYVLDYNRNWGSGMWLLNNLSYQSVLFVAGFVCGRNMKVHDLERKMEGKDIMNEQLEDIKDVFKKYSMALLSLSLSEVVLATFRNDTSDQMFGIGVALIGSAMYVIRTETPPPGKALTRVVEWAKGLLRPATAMTMGTDGGGLSKIQ